MRARSLFPLGALLAGAALGACGSAPRESEEIQPRDSVSVGYGKQDPKNVATSVASVGNDERANSGASGLEQLIEGKVTGVEVLRSGSRISLRVRGTNSINNTTEPLYVVDGMVIHADSFSDAMMGINPRDVARIDILKDAAATAIYGSQGANGVVLVTTRRGH